MQRATPPLARIYRFDDFVLDPERGLFHSGETVAIEPLALAVLTYLLEQRGRIVSREELNERLWGGRIVSDAALSTQIRTVRRALGDDRGRQRFIKTYPRRGFAFIASATIGAPCRPADGLPESRKPGESSAPMPSPQRRSGWTWGLAVAAALAMVVAVAAWTVRDPVTAGFTPAPGLSIAVLPFENLSGDPARDYLADAFTEDLVTDLSRIRDAFVISRSTTFTYRDTSVDPTTVAAELGVRYVLEGSLRVEEDRALVNARLVDGTTGRSLWSDRYDRDLEMLFDVQNTVTGRIASVLRAELRIAEDQRQEPELADDAWDLALRGNVILYNHDTLADYQEAHALLSRAVALDPTISSAWGGLAFVHFVASVTDVPGVSQPDSARQSLDAALRAVQADPMNAEPYWLVGAGYARLGQPDRGMTACRTALDLNPNMDCGHVCAGLVHLAMDEPERAVPYFEYALQLNPRFRPFTKEKYLGLAHIQSGRNDQAIAAFNRALAAAPRDSLANLALTAALALDGQMAEARETLHRHYQQDPGSLPTLSGLEENLAWMGPRMDRLIDGLRLVGMPESF